MVTLNFVTSLIELSIWIKAAVTSGNPSLWGSMAFAVRIKQNYKLIPEKSLVGLAVSQYDADTVEFVQSPRENHRSIGG